VVVVIDIGQPILSPHESENIPVVSRLLNKRQSDVH